MKLSSLKTCMISAAKLLIMMGRLYVRVAGLEGDYLRRSVGSVLDVIIIADSVSKLTARCEVCGKSAFFTLRKADETKTEVITGAEVYMTVCRKHYVGGEVVKEATNVVLEFQSRKISSVFRGFV